MIHAPVGPRLRLEPLRPLTAGLCCGPCSSHHDINHLRGLLARCVVSLKAQSENTSRLFIHFPFNQLHRRTKMASAKTPQQKRRQNALAQRNYRARQRDRRKILEHVAISSLILPAPLVYSQPPSQRSHDRHRVAKPTQQARRVVSSSHSDTSFHHLNVESGFTASDFFSCIGSYPEWERHNFFILMTKELFGVRDIIKYGLIFLGYPVSSSLYGDAMLLPMSQWLEDVRQSLGYVDFTAAIKAGISVFGKLNVPLEHNSRIHEIVASPLCRGRVDTVTDCILLSRVSFVSAVFMNALHLGIPWHDLITLESESPFCRLTKRLISKNSSFKNDAPGLKNTGQAAQIRLAFGDYFKGIQSDLVPTDVQLTVPHHPTLDTIPWPGFRSKVIAAVHSDPPSIDREDFCLDLLNDGLRCWGFANGDSLPSVAPWDARNWEAAPWFLKKWEHLTDGRDGDEWKISAWWWSMCARTNV
ncbi:hypothetical protein EDB81DRAFT_831468 [Dactylonectria macrodidyma]|uniref:BZIP domain-containing protein n=1 Tax=Dactylonectria macrodidyma TaxID=307937 RepID=A0A9P9I8S6_9HYPO|nr:hypothetical protein EDB81DRAFT_831468 [Dactylonectria macrodidyma]